VPFTWFCEWKFSGRSDLECALVEGTPGRDGIVRKRDTKLEHNVEITWPLKGKEKKLEIQQLINQSIK